MKTRRVLYAVICTIVFVGCVHSNRAVVIPDVWGNAMLVTEQRIELERLRGDFERMGEYQREISDGIERITVELMDGIERSSTIEAIFGEVDGFVRKLIDENNKLRALQSTDNRADAGER